MAAAAPTGREDCATQGRAGSVRVAGGISLVNFAVYALSLATGPLLARALGPAGRGELAAIIVTPAILAMIADLGLSTYTVREAARGRAVRDFAGSVAPLSVVLGLLVAAAGPFVADFIANGRDRVFLFVLIGCSLMPITLVLGLLVAINWAREQWALWVVVRIVPAIGGLVVTVVLFVGDWLTVTSAALGTLILALLGHLPLLSLVRASGRPRWDLAVAREAIRFGSRAWLFSIAALANARVDQLMMTRLVTSAELGLYAVAVNVTILQTAVRSAVISAIFPRIARGDSILVARAVRTTLVTVAAVSALLVVPVGAVLPGLFGNDFSEAVDMARILLVAAIPQAGVEVLAAGMVGGGDPGSAARGQLLALGVMIPGLSVVVSPLGGEGAALVALLAYSVAFVFLLSRAVSRLGGRWLDYLFPRTSDLAALIHARPRLREPARLT